MINKRGKKRPIWTSTTTLIAGIVLWVPQQWRWITADDSSSSLMLKRLPIRDSHRIYNKSPLNDKSLPWYSNIERPWLKVDFDRLLTNGTNGKRPGRIQDTPPVMLLMTDYGWNSPNQTYGQSVYRGWRIREIMDALVNHKYFHPTAWRDIEEGIIPLPPPTTRYYVFLDQDTCMESNYPIYNQGKEGLNKERGTVWMAHLHRLQKVMSTKLMTSSTLARYILFDCSGSGPKSAFYDNRKEIEPDQHYKMVWATISAHESQLQEQDFGLPPPALAPCSDEQRTAMETTDCASETALNENRSVLLSFVGNYYRRKARKALRKLHNGKNVIVVHGVNKSMQDLAIQSVFGAAPRGDNLFSYRFTETLSCGAIPVIYADGWVLPFRLREWEQASVQIAEDEASQSLEILSNISKFQQCQMRQKGLELYEKYLKSGGAVLEGILDRLELQTSQ